MKKYFRFVLAASLLIVAASYTKAQSTNLVPVVTWVQPTNGAGFPAGATILLRARASDSDGILSFMEFFANSNFLGRVTGPPSPTNTYTFPWSNAPAGTFQLHAE